MMLHCPDCDARAFLFDHGVVERPACLECGRPLPMPGAGARVAGPMSPYPEQPRRRPSRRQQLHA